MSRVLRYVALVGALAGVGEASAAPVRLGLFVGSAKGLPGEPELRYAHRDAQRMRDVMARLGRVEAPRLLLDPDAGEVRRALIALRQTAAARAPARVELIVFYSGHADAQTLHLGDDRLGLQDLRRAIDAVGATLTVTIVDACRGAVAGQAKGVEVGARPAETAVDVASGRVFIQSVREGERAVELDRLQASVFSHYLIAGLQGAADKDADRRVTLSEAFQVARRQAMLAQVVATGAAAHPQYEMAIEGGDDIVLTHLARKDAQLRFDAGLEGTFYVAEAHDGRVVAELSKERGPTPSLHLPRGRYVVYSRWGRAVQAAELSLRFRSLQTVTEDSFRRYDADRVLHKGGRIDLRRWRLSVGTALRSGLLSGMRGHLMPTVRLTRWRDRLGVAFEAVLGQASLRTQDDRADNRYVGVSLWGGTRWRGAWLHFEPGLFVRALWLRQRLSDEAARSVGAAEFGLSPALRVVLGGPLSLALAPSLYVSVYRRDSGRRMRLGGAGQATLGYDW